MSDDIKADLGQDIQKSWEGGEVTRNGQRLQDYEFKAPWKQVLDDGTTITRTTAWTAPGLPRRLQRLRPCRQGRQADQGGG